ncbi:MAG TPA: glycosyltransferase family 4 protein [Ardenticatenaceae bacterium]
MRHPPVAPIRVAMIIQGYLPRVGGAERQLAALAPLLQAQGVELSVLTRRYPGLAPFEIIGGVPVHRLPIPGPKAVASLSFTLSALWLLRRLRPHVIHAHELLSPTTAAVAAKRLFGVPVVAKVLRGGELGDVAKLQSRSSGISRLQRFRHEVDGFIVISKEIDEELAGVGVPPEKRFFIPNGVDLERFASVSPEEKAALRASLGLPDGPIALFTGRLVPEKRVDQLVALWPTIRATHPAATLLVLGTGGEEARLQQMAGGGVRFTGRIEDVVPYLQAADLFVLPSATEGLSNALLEAMAAGLAVVATSVGGAPDVIEHGDNGWLVPPDDRAALEAALLALLGDAERRATLGQRARERVTRDYALPVIAQRLYALYSHLVSGQPLATTDEGRRTNADG